MFRAGEVLVGHEDKKSVTRTDAQKCGRCVRSSLLRSKLASETAWVLDCFSRLCSLRAIALNNRNLVGHGLFRGRPIGGQHHTSLGDGIPSSRKWDVDLSTNSRS